MLSWLLKRLGGGGIAPSAALLRLASCPASKGPSVGRKVALRDIIVTVYAAA